MPDFQELQANAESPQVHAHHRTRPWSSSTACVSVRIRPAKRKCSSAFREPPTLGRHCGSKTFYSC
ncbi:hypothetical protein ZHAS_00020581 [Anopheles sinensis]|uniref:Uncharacterized protein n=1 Tax=Anopheles sinensis TaxID=74873 RepID=A0A084WQ76_ANOSI|nr:hypothetical protein ZHAS_00020581 [Anopheles sinensis]